MKTFLPLLLSLCLLTACAVYNGSGGGGGSDYDESTPMGRVERMMHPKPLYRLPDGSFPSDEQQFAADQAECNAQARPFDTGGARGLIMVIHQKELCMSGKGYICTQGKHPCR
jgi:hypothetical protein